MAVKLPPRIAKPLFLFAAVVMFGLAFRFAGGDSDFFETAERTPGQVIEVRAERGFRGERLYRPVVRFTVPASGRAITFDSGFRLWPSPYSAGDEVTVAYDPVEPEHAEIDSFWSRYFYPLLMAFVGAVCLLALWITAKQGPRSGKST